MPCTPGGVPQGACRWAAAAAGGRARTDRRWAVGRALRWACRASCDAGWRGCAGVVGFPRLAAVLVPVRHAGRARARSRARLRPHSAGAACSSPTTRSTPRDWSVAAAWPGGHRKGVPSSRRPARQAQRCGGLYVFGGAAMALAYDSRRATRDVDALFKPPWHCAWGGAGRGGQAWPAAVVAERAGQFLCRARRGSSSHLPRRRTAGTAQASARGHLPRKGRSEPWAGLVRETKLISLLKRSLGRRWRPGPPLPSVTWAAAPLA